MGMAPPWRARPFMTPPIPCSRTPKARARPSGCSTLCCGVVVELGPGVAGQVGPARDQARDRVGDGVEGLVDGAGGWRPVSPGLSRSGASPASRDRPWPPQTASHSSRSPAQAASRFSHVARARLPRGDGLAIHVEDLVGHPEGLVRRQPEDLLGRPDLVLAERRAVGLRGVGHMRRGLADVAAQDQQARAVLDGHGPAHGRLEGVGVVGDLAQTLDVPAVGLEALGRVVVQGELGRPVDGDVVVVVDVDADGRARGARRAMPPRG